MNPYTQRGHTKASTDFTHRLLKVSTVGDWGHDLQTVKPEAPKLQIPKVTAPVDRFADATKRLLQREGGSKLVTDSGGLTRYGISQKAYPKLDIRNLTEQQAMDIYKKDYWPSKLQSYPRIQEKLYDLNVNMGHGHAGRILQKALVDAGADISVDGIVGPKTIAALGAIEDRNALLNAIKQHQLARYNYLVTHNPTKYKKYHEGWLNRADFMPPE